MRAVVFRDPDRPVEVADVELDAPRQGEVRVRIAAAGVCHSDLHVRRGDWRVATPLVMGHEGSGTVVATGAGVTSVREGDPVILSWVPACGRCQNCRAGHPARCELCADVLAPHGVLYDGTTRLHRDGERIHHYLSVSSFAEEVLEVVPTDLGELRSQPVAQRIRRHALDSGGNPSRVLGARRTEIALRGLNLQEAGVLRVLFLDWHEVEDAVAPPAADVDDLAGLDHHRVAGFAEVIPFGCVGACT